MKNEVANRPVTFTDDELMVLGLCLLMSAQNIAMSRDMVQHALDHNRLEGGLDAILTAMELVRTAQHQLEIIEHITEKLGDSIPG